MIGNENDWIVSGYDFGSFDAEPVLRAAQEIAAKKLINLRIEQKGRKGRLESAKNDLMESGASEESKHRYLFTYYVPRLRQIGIDLDKAEVQIQLAISAQAKTNKGGSQYAWAYKWVRTADSSSLNIRLKTDSGIYKVYQDVIVLYRGAAGYEEHPERTQAVQRPVYRKKLGMLGRAAFKDGESNQYVRDDRGVFTRRYAYTAKTLEDAAIVMQTTQGLTGRYQRNRGDTLELTKELRNQFPALKKQKKLTVEQMLYVHQELGSGSQQRGVCLSSSPKTIHGNKGKAFDNEETVVFMVDLAKVPTGENMLFNLYTQDAQRLTIGLERNRCAPGLNFSRLENYSAEDAKRHTDTSTAKNREIYLRVLRKDFVEAITGKEKLDKYLERLSEQMAARERAEQRPKVQPGEWATVGRKGK